MQFSYRWLPSTVHKNLSHAWYDVTCGIRNLIRWTPVIWDDVDWDWTSLADVMRQKLLWMAEHEEKYGHHVSSKRDAKQQRVCAALLKRLIDDNYLENTGYNHDPWSGVFNDEHHRMFKHSEYMANQDQRYLGMMLGKYLRNWWD